MKIGAEVLFSKLKLLLPCLPKQDINPVLSCFYFTGNAVEAYNGKTFGKVELKTEFSGLIPSELLMSTLQVLKSREVELTVAEAESVLKLKSGRFNSQITMLQAPVNDFTEVEKIVKKEITRKEPLAKMEILDVWQNVLTTTEFVSSTRRNVFFNEQGVALCTDGYRLHEYKGKPCNRSYELPVDAVNLLTTNKKENIKYVEVAKDFIKLQYEEVGVTYIVARQKVDKEEFERFIQTVNSIRATKVVGKIQVPNRLLNVLERIRVVGSRVLDKTCKVSCVGDELTIKAEIDIAKAEDKVRINNPKQIEFHIVMNYEHLLFMLQLGISNEIEYLRVDDETALLLLKDKTQSFCVSARVVK